MIDKVVTQTMTEKTDGWVKQIGDMVNIPCVGGCSLNSQYAGCTKFCWKYVQDIVIATKAIAHNEAVRMGLDQAAEWHKAQAHEAQKQTRKLWNDADKLIDILDQNRLTKFHVFAAAAITEMKDYLPPQVIHVEYSPPNKHISEAIPKPAITEEIAAGSLKIGGIPITDLEVYNQPPKAIDDWG